MSRIKYFKEWSLKGLSIASCLGLALVQSPVFAVDIMDDFTTEFDIKQEIPVSNTVNKKEKTVEKKAPKLEKTNTINSSINSSDIKLQGLVEITDKKEKINLSLRNTDVRQVLRMLADKAGVNIAFHSSVEGKATLDLVDVDLNKAIEYVLSLNGLTYTLDNNTMIVASKKEAVKIGLKRRKMTSIAVKYLDAKKVESFLNESIFNADAPGTNSGHRVVSNPATNEIIIFGEDKDIELAKKIIAYVDVKPSMQTYTVKFIDAYTMAAIICDVIFPSESDTAQGAQSQQTDSTDYEQRLFKTVWEKAEQGSSTPKGGSKRVACGKVTKSSGNQEFIAGSSYIDGEGNTESVGLGKKELAVVFYPALNELMVYGATNQQSEEVENLISQFDKPQPQAYMEISVIELTEAGSKQWQVNLGGNEGRGLASFDPTTGITSAVYTFSGAVRDTSNNRIGGVALNADGTTTAIDWVDSLAKNLWIGLQAMIENKQAKLLSNPRIVATNYKVSEINLVNEYVQSSETELSEVANTTVRTTTYTAGEAGIKIKVLPKITDEGYIFLNVRPEFVETSDVYYNSYGDIGFTLTNKKDFALENVRMKDGETLVIGGLIQEKDIDTKRKVPFFGDIPIIGPLFFRGTEAVKEKRELVIMITPKVIKEDIKEDIKENKTPPISNNDGTI